MVTVDDECWVDVTSSCSTGFIMRPTRLYLVLENRRVLLDSLKDGESVVVKRFRRYGTCTGHTPCFTSVDERECGSEAELESDTSHLLPCPARIYQRTRLCQGNFSHTDLAVQIRNRNYKSEENTGSFQLSVLNKYMRRQLCDSVIMARCINRLNCGKVLISMLAPNHISLIVRNSKLTQFILYEWRKNRNVNFIGDIKIKLCRFDKRKLSLRTPLRRLTSGTFSTIACNFGDSLRLDRRERLTFLELDAFRSTRRTRRTKACIVLLRQAQVVHCEEDEMEYVIYA